MTRQPGNQTINVKKDYQQDEEFIELQVILISFTIIYIHCPVFLLVEILVYRGI